MSAKLFWKIGSAILSIAGLLHVHGIFFGTDLYPKDKAFIDLMKSQMIEMSNESNIWKIWIGFHAAFGNAALAAGVINIYIAQKYFTICRNRFLIGFTLLYSGFYVWLGYEYLITPATLVFLAAFLCYLVAGCILIIQMRNKAPEM